MLMSMTIMCQSYHTTPPYSLIYQLLRPLDLGQVLALHRLLLDRLTTHFLCSFLRYVSFLVGLIETDRLSALSHFHELLTALSPPDSDTSIHAVCPLSLLPVS